MTRASAPVPDLVCPIDGLPLAREPLPFEGAAILSCARHRYPEVCSIPVLQDSPLALAALDRLACGDAAAARAVLLAPDRWGWADSFARAADRLLRSSLASSLRRARRASRFRKMHGDAPFATYRDALRALLLGRPSPQPESYHYFFNRPSDPTFVVAEAVTAGVSASGAILDTCCGTGQVTRLLAGCRSREVTGLDGSFALLHLARTYLAPRARFVCARADRPLPFLDGSFRAVVCSDALHDVSEPALLAREMLRVIAKNGTIFGIHLHNPAFTHPYPGRNPLTAAGYASIFSAGDPRLLDEGPILRRWIEDREVDLSASRAPSSLERARTLTLLAGSREPDRTHRNDVGDPEHLVLSPLYEAAASGDGLLLRRRWPSPLYPREYPEAETYLPESASIGAGSLSALRRDRLDAETAKLFRRRVILDLPPSYGAHRPWGYETP